MNRRVVFATSPALAVVALSLVALSLPACTRRPKFVPLAADSSAVAVDSLAVFAREAAQRWESGDEEKGADASARVVHEALRLRPTAPWSDRTRAVLDSLGIAAEISGDDRAMVVNLFSRSEPEGRSWPYLFWRGDAGVRHQGIDGGGLHLGEVATLGFAGAAAPRESAQTAVLWGRRVGGGQQPLLMVWRYARGGRWDLLQTLGADSLGGTGTGEFSVTDSSTEMTVKTFRPTPYFDECATCPHVYHERRFLWGGGGFMRLDDRLVPSPYSTFAALVSALVAGDRPRASRFVVDPSLIDFARHLEWNLPGRGRWRAAPETDESAIQMVFFRGQGEAFRVTFEAREGDWVIAGFEPTVRSLE